MEECKLDKLKKDFYTVNDGLIISISINELQCVSPENYPLFCFLDHINKNIYLIRKCGTVIYSLDYNIQKAIDSIKIRLLFEVCNKLDDHGIVDICRLNFTLDKSKDEITR